MTGLARPATRSARPPTTCASSAASTCSPAGPVTALPGPAHSRPHHRRPAGLREQGIGPILAGVGSLGWTQPVHRTRIDRDDQTLRTGMQTRFHDLAIITGSAVAQTTLLSIQAPQGPR
jgi:hypothetical protein